EWYRGQVDDRRQGGGHSDIEARAAGAPPRRAVAVKRAVESGGKMKICHYNQNEAGIIEGDKVYPIGDALVRGGHLRNGYTMVEVVDALANRVSAMEAARGALKSATPLPLASVKLLAPITNPPSLWAAAANYRAHQAEMKIKMGSADRAELSKDELM